MYDGLTRGLTRGLSRRITRLSRRMLLPPRAVRRAVDEATALLTPLLAPTEYATRGAGTVGEITGFGSNPGGLGMLLQLPPEPPHPGAPLLVLLHGCGQDPARFAAASGFAALAARVGAPLLLPVQRPDNNSQGCFNWFHPADARRGGGEAASVRQMVAEALRRCAGDPKRVFIAGLSAGGALTAALLAAYPEVFAGGAVVAGLPVGAAHNLAGAMAQMGYASREKRDAWVARVPSGTAKRWPRLSIWHGSADHVVHPGNADALAAQWTGLLGLPEAPDQESRPAPRLRRLAWGDAVEQWSIDGLGHGFPVARAGAHTDPFVLPGGIAAAEAIGRFWGVDPG